ncbi:MAG: UDP-2,3-diacylglucosamine diphosphatase [Candidatus Fibromonas sp.]|jgi:UDP-2,3-diacylglucosamine hydrolase|nr:UDP-2,3-diacylglucosamine diphosphatase [Candidatus Fibromonas sp.]
MSAAYFISDVHLGISPRGAVPEREEHLLAFLKGLEGKASHLFIVGDLFEFWYEYDFYVPSRHFRILRALAGLRDWGCEIRLIRGNHDFACGDFFERELGIEVCSHFVTELHGRKLYICHGDGLAGVDGSYRFFRKILDFKPNRFLFKWLHPDIGMRFALAVGSNSRDFNKKRIVPEEEYLDRVREIMRKNNCDTFVHGHNHLGGLWKVPEGVVINCGQWLFEENFSCVSQKICYFYASHSVEPSSAC